jgi:hypothetical protein
LQSLSFSKNQKTFCFQFFIVLQSGFGDGLEGSGSWKACLKYVDDQVTLNLKPLHSASDPVQDQNTHFFRENMLFAVLAFGVLTIRGLKKPK